MAESMYVHVDRGGGQYVLAGQFLFDTESAKPKDRGGRFKYAASYISDPLAFALDPINLPLEEGRIFFTSITRSSPGTFGVFTDSGADAWGRALMRLLLDPAPSTEVGYLLAGSGQGCGALRFTTSSETPAPSIAIRQFDSLQSVQDASMKISAGETVDPVCQALFRGSMGIGGMRPKAFIEVDGKAWIAKFDRVDDPFSYAIAEHVCMQMAADVRIDVAPTHLLRTPSGPVCCVERFDRVDDVQHHMISIGSLLNAFDITQYNPENTSYPGIVQMARRLGDGGEEVADQMYRRMLLNIAIGNTDDHVRNHALILRSGAAGYRLSPAYDIVSNHRLVGSQAIAVGDFGNTANYDNLRSAAKRMGMSEEAARVAASDVFDVVSRWEERVASAGMGSAGRVQMEKSLVKLPVIGKFAMKSWKK